MTGQNKTFRGKRHDGTANPIDVYVGSRIQKLRIAKGWSQSKLASLLGINVETAVRKPDPSFFQTADFYIPSRPVRFSAGSRPPQKTLLLKETFSQLQFIVSTGVSITKQIQHMRYGKSPLTTDVLRLQRIRTKPLCQTIVSP